MLLSTITLQACGVNIIPYMETEKSFERLRLSDWNLEI